MFPIDEVTNAGGIDGSTGGMTDDLNDSLINFSFDYFQQDKRRRLKIDLMN